MKNLQEACGEVILDLHDLISRFYPLEKVLERFLLRSGNGLVFTSQRLTSLVRSFGLK